MAGYLEHSFPGVRQICEQLETMTANIFQALLVFETIFAAFSAEQTTYYVVNRQFESTCLPDQTCKHLRHYIDNGDKFFDRHYNSITMKFTAGIHSSYCFESETITISTPNFELTGEGPEVTQVYCLDVHFNNIMNLRISRMRVSVWNLTVTAASFKTQQMAGRLQTELWILSVIMNEGTSSVAVSDITNIYLQNTTAIQTYFTLQGSCVRTVELRGCTFHSGIRTTFAGAPNTTITVTDCVFVNSPVFVYDTKIVLAGTSELKRSRDSSALLVISGTLGLSGSITFAENSAFRGAAMALYSSLIVISPGADVTFANNSVSGKGGAMFIEFGLTKNVLLQRSSIGAVCFYELLDCNDNASYNFHFVNNSAERGGNDVYGVSLQSTCQHQGKTNCRINVTTPQGVPSVSSDPTRVCICDENGRPQCTNESYHSLSWQVRSGEVFTLQVVVVGGDFGPTVGVIFATISPPLHLTTPSQHSQLITTAKQCTRINYSIYSSESGVAVKNMTLSTSTSTAIFRKGAEDYEYCIKRDYCIRTAPLTIYINLLSCPQGFTLLGDPPICDCYPELSTSGVECSITNGRETFSWHGRLWVGTEGEGVLYGECPSNYCKTHRKEINVISEADAQCAFNRAGRLCGRCRENYSLAIGSSHCIYCPNDNHNLSLLIFFAAAGILLVCFVNFLNLTVAQGALNGIIFYANIVWQYQGIFFANNEAENAAIVILKVFIAWMNLDFGIETCFVNGLTAFWKTWLQFVFPFYVWTIAGSIVVGTRYSSRLTRIFGSRAVPILNTIILLSYTKLLNTAISALEFSFIVYSEYPAHSEKFVVWSIDASLTYLGFPHVLLFLAALATLLFLWLPYTLLLLFAQWLRRLPNWRFLKKITLLHPVYDAYLAPLKHVHQYWFGILLLVRGGLLVTFASTLGISSPVNLLLLLILSTILLLYLAYMKPYKTAVLLFLQMVNFANLAALSGFYLFTYTQSNASNLQVTAVGVSTGAVLAQFCVIVLHAVVTKYASKCSCSRPCKKVTNDRDGEEERGIDYAALPITKF